MDNPSQLQPQHKHLRRIGPAHIGLCGRKRVPRFLIISVDFSTEGEFVGAFFSLAFLSWFSLVAGQHAISFARFPSFTLSVCSPVLVTRAAVEMVHVCLSTRSREGRYSNELTTMAKAPDRENRLPPGAEKHSPGQQR
jgi:hypothetical protein